MGDWLEHPFVGDNQGGGDGDDTTRAASTLEQLEGKIGDAGGGLDSASPGPFKDNFVGEEASTKYYSSVGKTLRKGSSNLRLVSLKRNFVVAAWYKICSRSP